jgi:hypothetical protein
LTTTSISIATTLFHRIVCPDMQLCIGPELNRC